MARHRIPTARFHRRIARRCAARRAIGELGMPVVLKADGLAAGKGVVIARPGDSGRALVAACATADSARPATPSSSKSVLPGRKFRSSCSATGRALPIGSAQDHNGFSTRPRAQYGRDGAFAPSPLCDARLDAGHARGRQPGHRRDGRRRTSVRGFLYVGLMLTADGPKVIEFNVRLGDPRRKSSCRSSTASRAAAVGRCEGQLHDPACRRQRSRCRRGPRLARLSESSNRAADRRHQAGRGDSRFCVSRGDRDP